MGPLLYLFIAFIVQFFVIKKYWRTLQQKLEDSDDYSAVWLEYKEGYIIVFVPIFWIITVPFWLIWIILEYIYDKLSSKYDILGSEEDFNNKNNIKNNNNEEFF